MLNLVGVSVFIYTSCHQVLLPMDATSTIRGIAKQDVCLEGLLLLY